MEDCGCGMAKAIQPYVGSLSSRKEVPDNVKKAHGIWMGINKRCENPKDGAFKYYGGRGIKSCVTSRRFITWYLEQISKRAVWQIPSLDRINNDGNYCYCNIQLLEQSENSQKSNAINHRKRSKLVGVYETLAIEPFS